MKESPVVLALLDEAEKIGSASLGRVKEAPSPRPDPGYRRAQQAVRVLYN